MVIAAAKAEVGYREGRSGGRWNNKEKFADMVPGLEWVDNAGAPWCAVFAAYSFLKGGLKAGKDFPATASCDVAMAWFKKRRRFSEYPGVGAQIFFGVPGDSTHTGVVVKYGPLRVWTTEGNTNTSGSREGDGVYSKTYLRRTKRILGYGYPKFPEGIVSADPAWKGRK